MCVDVINSACGCKVQWHVCVDPCVDILLQPTAVTMYTSGPFINTQIPIHISTKHILTSHTINNIYTIHTNSTQTHKIY